MKNILRSLLLVVTIMLTINVFGYNSIETAVDESEYPNVIENQNI